MSAAAIGTGLIALGVCLWLARRLAVSLGRPLGLFAALAFLAATVATPLALGWIGLQQPERPPAIDDVTYETSASCRPCHADHYDSWHRTYHRTMTQEASPETIVGRFDDEPLFFYGVEARAFREGDRFFMEVVEPAWEHNVLRSGGDPADHENPPTIRLSVDRVVGSHNMQAYLMRADRHPKGEYRVLPLVWHIAEQRWITRGGSFLSPEKASLYYLTSTWNTGCIFCHNTRPNPGRVADETGRKTLAWNSEVAELGIACEACHGPGSFHREKNRNPVARILRIESGAGDSSMFNPDKYDRELALEACARCHGKWRIKPEYEPLMFTEGDSYRPGNWGLDAMYEPKQPVEGADFTEAVDGHYFWPDGTPRPNALDVQALQLTGCHTEGQMSCLSCHSMHDADPDDQLRFPEIEETPEHESNRACIQCHEKYNSTEMLVRHTHHEEHSAGSRCYNCHMPFTSWAMLKSMRSHRVSSPDIERTRASGRPNACTQCHVDRPLGWAAEHLAAWYDHPLPALTDVERDISATAVQLVQGHALNRALAASRLRDADALEAAPGAWRIPLLIETLSDSYAAVRVLGYQGLRDWPAYSDWSYDYLAHPRERRERIEEARTIWRDARPEIGFTTEPSVLVRPDGSLDDAIYRKLRRTRDETVISVRE